MERVLEHRHFTPRMATTWDFSTTTEASVTTALDSDALTASSIIPYTLIKSNWSLDCFLHSVSDALSRVVFISS